MTFQCVVTAELHTFMHIVPCGPHPSSTGTSPNCHSSQPHFQLASHSQDTVSRAFSSCSPLPHAVFQPFSIP